MAGKNKITYVDLFCGAGGLSLGLDKAGFEGVFITDNDKDCHNTFTHNVASTPFLLTDIEDLKASDVKKIIGNKKINILAAGIPCQSFSMAGRRIRKHTNQINDSRNFLFKEVMRLSKILSPDIILIENVKGILSHNNGNIKQEILDTLESLGYKVDFQLLNAADYGVPQLRERVIFLANKINKDNIFPQKKVSSNKYKPVWSVLANVKGYNHEPRLLTGVSLERVKKIKPGQNWMNLPEELRTKSIHSGAYGRLDPDKPSRTITTRFDTPSVGYVTHPYENRTLTVREGARIQGFPDNFEFLGSKMSQFRQVGNAVPVGLAFEIAKSLREMLE